MVGAFSVQRIRDAYRRKVATLTGRRAILLRPPFPVVSFTFDDFPQSAARVAGPILDTHNMRATYYVSLGLMDQELPAGRAFSKGDLAKVVSDGHELGCHTFAHCHAWETNPRVFEESVVKNKRVLEELVPGASFKSLSYPIGMPRPETKRRMSKYYPCCRGGGETINVGVADANNLSASFLEKHREEPDTLKRLIDENSRQQGWLIFATHDVGNRPSPFGCTPDLFADVVRYVAGSGAKVLPVGEAWSAMTKVS